MFTDADSPRDETRLHAILLRELALLTPDLLPGVEDVASEQMLRDYGRWAEQGTVPGPQQLAQQYPELSAQLHAFFDPSASAH